MNARICSMLRAWEYCREIMRLKHVEQKTFPSGYARMKTYAAFYYGRHEDFTLVEKAAPCFNNISVVPTFLSSFSPQTRSWPFLPTPQAQVGGVFKNHFMPSIILFPFWRFCLILSNSPTLHQKTLRFPSRFYMMTFRNNAYSSDGSRKIHYRTSKEVRHIETIPLAYFCREAQILIEFLSNGRKRFLSFFAKANVYVA